MDVGTTHGVEPVALSTMLAGRLRDRRLIDGPARLAVGAARRPDADADEDGFLLCAFLLLRLFGYRYSSTGITVLVCIIQIQYLPVRVDYLYSNCVGEMY